MITIITSTERYSVDNAGNIGRPEINMKPSGQWKLLGFERLNNFGHVVEYIPFENVDTLIKRADWCHKNNKPKWHIRDLDHGTMRVWGRGIQSIKR